MTDRIITAAPSIASTDALPAVTRHETSAPIATDKYGRAVPAVSAPTIRPRRQPSPSR